MRQYHRWLTVASFDKSRHGHNLLPFWYLRFLTTWEKVEKCKIHRKFHRRAAFEWCFDLLYIKHFDMAKFNNASAGTLAVNSQNKSNHKQKFDFGVSIKRIWVVFFVVFPRWSSPFPASNAPTYSKTWSLRDFFVVASFSCSVLRFSSSRSCRHSTALR